MISQLLKGIISFALLQFILHQGILCECPDDALIQPCVCEDQVFRCIGDKKIDLKAIFAKLSKELPDDGKDFEAVHLENSAIDELPGNVFGDIYFREIHIDKCTNLKKIHLDTFSGTDIYTESIKFKNSPDMVHKPNTLIFDILNKFKKLQGITIRTLGLTEIPANAFKAHENLVWLMIGGPKITKVGAKAFSELKTITELHLINTSITKISKDVFVFQKKSDIPLDICLYSNSHLDSFDVHAFTDIGRPTDLDFSGDRFTAEIAHKQMPILEENAFLPFLKANDENKIEMKGQHFDCTNCKNHWLKKHPKLLKRVLNVKCKSGKDVTDSGNFAGCK